MLNIIVRTLFFYAVFDKHSNLFSSIDQTCYRLLTISVSDASFNACLLSADNLVTHEAIHRNSGKYSGLPFYAFWDYQSKLA